MSDNFEKPTIEEWFGPDADKKLADYMQFHIWLPISEYKSEYGEVDLWCDGHREVDCTGYPDAASPYWFPRNGPIVSYDYPTHFMRIRGPNE